MKRTVLDPQGQTVRSALTGLGYQAVSDVRQGKFFEIALADGVDSQSAREAVEAYDNGVVYLNYRPQ